MPDGQLELELELEQSVGFVAKKHEFEGWLQGSESQLRGSEGQPRGSQGRSVCSLDWLKRFQNQPGTDGLYGSTDPFNRTEDSAYKTKNKSNKACMRLIVAKKLTNQCRRV